MIKKNNTNNKNEKKYIGILKYLTYQNIEIDNELINHIHKLSLNKNTEIDNLSYKKKERILKLINIFKDTFGDSIDYKYYILILESLPSLHIRNLFRLFNYKYIKLQNENEKFNNLEIKFFKWKYNLYDISITPEPKEKLIDLLEFIKKKDNNIIHFFISCINLFFT